jgi:RNA polymerase sigma-70 factor, ECF subfamily
MGYLREPDMGPSFQPWAGLREQFGFVPSLFRAQALLPGMIEAEAALLDRLLFRQRALSRIQKELILLMLAVAQQNTACVAIHYQMLRLLAVPEPRLDQIMTDYQQAGLSPPNTALVTFALKLGMDSAAVSREDVTSLLGHGLTEESALEAVLITALGNFLCRLSTGLGALPDFAPKPLPQAGPAPLPDAKQTQAARPFLPAPERNPDDFAPFTFLRDEFGFVPELFRAQTLRPDVLEAEVEFIRAVLLSEGRLTLVQKEYILKGERPTALSEADGALLDFVAKLAEQPWTVGIEDIDLLRRQRFTDEQLLEAVAATALANFLGTLQFGLGAARDFSLRRFQAVPPKKAHLSTSDHRHTDVAFFVDPDAEWVARVQSGDLDAFEGLMNRHSQRVYRTLIGILGNPEEARDAMQDTFLKAFQNLRRFEGRSKFSTWLLSIASNTGIQLVRERKHFESLDEPELESDGGFRPRQLQAWTDDPEQLYSQTERRSLVENGVMKLPAKYRVVLMLRDIEQLPAEECAAALGLGIPAFKARLLRGRLMLREALAPHFTAAPSKGNAKGVTF